MTPVDEIREVFRECLQEIPGKYGITAIGVFGSYARGEAGSDSDIDIIIELDRPIGWIQVELSDYLESRHRHPVDLVIKRSLNALIRDAILAEVQSA